MDIYWSKLDKDTHYRNPERMYAREDMNIGAAQAAEGRVLDTEIDLETFGRGEI